jgi:hypothetical protein
MVCTYLHIWFHYGDSCLIQEIRRISGWVSLRVQGEFGWRELTLAVSRATPFSLRTHLGKKYDLMGSSERVAS